MNPLSVRANSKTAKPTVVAPTPTPSIEPSFEPTFEPSHFDITDANDIHYHGTAPIMTGAVNLYNIYFGNFSSPSSNTTKYLMDYLAANIGGTDWFNIKTAYYQINSDGTQTFESNQAKFIKRVEVQKTVQNGTLSDTDVITTIISLFNSRALPVDENGIYNVIFRGDYHYPGFLTQWCGYHYAFYLSTGQLIKFLAVGDSSTAPNGQGASCQAISDG